MGIFLQWMTTTHWFPKLSKLAFDQIAKGFCIPRINDRLPTGCLSLTFREWVWSDQWPCDLEDFFFLISCTLLNPLKDFGREAKDREHFWLTVSIFTHRKIKNQNGGFQFLFDFHPLPGDIIQFDQYFSSGCFNHQLRESNVPTLNFGNQPSGSRLKKMVEESWQKHELLSGALKPAKTGSWLAEIGFSELLQVASAVRFLRYMNWYV